MRANHPVNANASALLGAGLLEALDVNGFGSGRIIQCNLNGILQKQRATLRSIGVSFDEAITVFYDPLAATFNDPHHSVGEHRFITIGYSSRGRLFVVSHAERGESIRIISARRATAQERKRHET